MEQEATHGFDIVNKLLGITMLGTEWILWLLILLSIVSVAIMIERTLFFLRMRIDFKNFTYELTKVLLSNDTQSIRNLCERNVSLESQVVLRGLQYIDRGPKAMRESMEAFLIGERQVLDRGLVILGTLGNNAPFIGLFGTVIGIIMAFKSLALNTAGGPSVVMAGISEALVATAVGLMVAIPAVIGFNAFNRIVKRHYANAEAVMKLVLSHHSEN
jgi:biopolymer transport protein ExbB